MGRFVVKGGMPLSGNVKVSGAKNAALPIIFAAVAMNGISVIHGFPEIGDTGAALSILEELGAKIKSTENSLVIDTRELEYKEPSDEYVSALRASTYLLGASLARFGRAEIRRVGGCSFDERPIDMHIDAALAFGAVLHGENVLTVKKLRPATVRFKKISVGATVNALILAASAEGESRIYGYAKEPHVISLARFLSDAGADIELFDEYIKVSGTKLSGAECEIIPDMIEAGSYMALSLITGCGISVSTSMPEHLSSYILMLSRLGAAVEYSDGAFRLSGRATDFAKIKTAPYPQFPTDLAPVIAPVLALGGGGMIYEGVWHNRFGYLSSLAEYGVKYFAGDGFAYIEHSSVRPAHTVAADLRGGMAQLLLALSASGESVIECSETVKRGYSRLTEKLRALGADITEIS